MAIGVFILGHSGSGKSFSLHNLDPANVAVINVVGKPLPFKNGKNFKMVTTDDANWICQKLPTIKEPIVVIDDFQYIMANEFMRNSDVKGFDKFTSIGRNAWNILNTISHGMKDYQRVYILSHTEETATGGTKIKTIGKMLDEKITPEGMVSIVLQTKVDDGKNYFLTQNNGANTVKTPFEMFDDALIPNDLKFVDGAICDYYGITGEQS
ncbi:ATP-binding protein [Moraxella caviae]|uniref:ATP-binding protein n=1 Tax=Moraxella caviae TaxID=34060 RepID=A0A1T0A8N9_9GAMM|nr:ATP-binding protein [Moraxella caviae]OOR92112.1 ATP-binding protein [Moraxella caviae]STZ14472.1 Uncharacterised protein [Moraxella caviae]